MPSVPSPALSLVCGAGAGLQGAEDFLGGDGEAGDARAIGAGHGVGDGAGDGDDGSR